VETLPLDRHLVHLATPFDQNQLVAKLNPLDKLTYR
jgi:hypothetical protein